MQLAALSVIASLVGFAATAATPAATASATSMRIVTQFAQGTWLENLHILNDGQILMTVLTSPFILLLNPKTGVTKQLATVPGVTGTFGIAELSPTRFAIAAGNFTDDQLPLPIDHTFSLWTFDLHHNQLHKIMDTPEAGILNGLVAVNPHILLASDSTMGVVRRFDIRSRSHRIEITAPELMPDDTFFLGVNGLRYAPPFLFFSNTAQGGFGRVRINSNGEQTGRVEFRSDMVGVHVDDFALTPTNNAFVTTDPFNELMHITSAGVSSTFAGAQDSLEVAGCTSAQFSRDRKTLFVITNGARAAPINGTITEGGKVIAFTGRFP